jgi:glutathione synthase/RimK-type ligase-like ATP-grasp enzyme
MMREAASRGHQIWAAQQKNISFIANKVMVNARQLSILDDRSAWYEVLNQRSLHLPK